MQLSITKEQRVTSKEILGCIAKFISGVVPYSNKENFPLLELFIPIVKLFSVIMQFFFFGVIHDKDTINQYVVWCYL